MGDIFSIDIFTILSPIFGVMVMLIMMILMVIFFNKKRIFLIILTIHLFSLVIGFASLDIPNLPFTPWFQTFFIVFQTIFLMISSIEMFRYGKRT